MVKRKRDAEFAAASAEFAGRAKKRRNTFTVDDAVQRMKGTHSSQVGRGAEAMGAYGAVGNAAEAQARQNSVKEGKYSITKRAGEAPHAPSQSVFRSFR